MRKNLNKLATLALSGMMVMSMAMPAFAATEIEVPFDKIVHTDGQTHAPNTTFSFKIEYSDLTSYSDGQGTTYPVLKPTGALKDAISIADVTFAPVAGDLGTPDYDTSVTPKKFLGAHFTKENKIKVNPAAFTQDGYYLFKLTENKGDYEGIRYNKTEYTVVVMKGKASATNPDGVYVVVQKPGATGVEKPKYIENNYGKHQPPNNPEYPDPTPDPDPNPGPNPDSDPNPNDTTHNVIVTKKIKGAKPSNGKNFKFTVNVIPAQDSKEIYKVVAYDATQQGEQQESTDPANFKYVDVKNGKTVTFDNITEDKGFRIYGLSKNDKVVVTEQDGETYTMTVEVPENPSYIKMGLDTEQGAYKTTFKVKHDDAKLNVVNTKDQVTPTGIVMNVMPYALMLTVAGGLGAVFMNRKKEEE